ncbi:MAG: Trm112 family protein [Pseudomonadota bacterium]
MTHKAKTDPKFLEMLICPVTRGPLEYDADNEELISKRAKLAYPVRDGIPVMIASEAREFSQD